MMVMIIIIVMMMVIMTRIVMKIMIIIIVVIQMISVICLQTQPDSAISPDTVQNFIFFFSSSLL